MFTYTYDANSNRKIIEDLNGQGGRGEFRIAPTLGGTGERSRRPSSCANWSRPYTSVKTPHDLILQQFSVKPIDGDWRRLGGRGEFRIAPTLGGTGERSRAPLSRPNRPRPYTSVKTPHDLILQQFSVTPIDGGLGGRGEFRIAPTLGGTGERSRRPSSCANWSQPYTSVKTPHDLILQQFSVKPIDGDWRLAFLIAIGKST